MMMMRQRAIKYKSNFLEYSFILEEELFSGGGGGGGGRGGRVGWGACD